MKVSEIVNSLIADEWIAHNQYMLLGTLCRGPSTENVRDKLNEIADDEFKDHYFRLSAWQREHGFNVLNDPFDLLRKANDKFIKFDDNITTDKVVSMVIASEICAIASYKKFAIAVKKLYPDLAELFLEIAKEEDTHRLDCLDLLEQIKNQK